MGEPVTEEMLVSVERMCGVEYFPGDDVRAIVAEVRRLRALVTLAADACTARDWDMSPPDDFKAFVDAVRMSDLEMVMQSVKIASHRAGDAAGYARAERDVVAEVRRLLAEAEAALAAPGSWVPEYADAALRSRCDEQATQGGAPWVSR